MNISIQDNEFNQIKAQFKFKEAIEGIKYLGIKIPRNLAAISQVKFEPSD